MGDIYYEWITGKKEEMMNREEAVKWLKQIKIVGYEERLLNHTEAIDMAIHALQQEPCGDAISRQDVVKAVDKHTNDDGTLDDDITCILEDVPSVSTEKTKIDWNHGEIKELTNNYQPAILNNYLEEDLCIKNLSSASTEKTGHWIDKDDKSAVCSCCNRNNTLYGDFCKWCGAKMIEPQESEEV